MDIIVYFDYFQKLKMKLVALSLLFVLCLTQLEYCAGDIGKCCSLGFKHGLKVTSSSITCNEKEMDIRAIGNTDHGTCGRTFTACCNIAADRELCTEGLSFAMSGLQCTQRSGPGGAVHKRCCDCCKDGIRNAKVVGSCIPNDKSSFCPESFTVCCKSEKARLALVTKAPTTKPVVITTKPTTKRLTRPTLTTTTSQLTCLDLACTHGCHYKKDRPMCLCRSGFRLAADQQTCRDIDECQENTYRCPKNRICKNTEGSYTCILDATGKKCDRAGYVTGQNGECIDEDECASGGTSCERNQVCLNTDGSYICLLSCPYGYRKQGRLCQDIDECADDTRLCPKFFSCINQVGSYHCKRTACQTGYALIDEQCYDINECEENKKICGEGGRCINQLGSYYCQCSTGFTRNLATNKCEDLDECTRRHSTCAHKCINTRGSYKCDCPRGYTTVKHDCIDVDECAQNTDKSLCPKGFSCHNTYGGFSCIKSTCPSNFYIQRSKYECKLYCPGTDACKHILEESIKWVAYSFRKTVYPENFAFTYFLRINSYLKTKISFRLVEGNEERNFYVKPLSPESVKIINVRKLTGPKEYNLRLHADVIYNGKTTTRFVYLFYLYVSEYEY